MTEEEYDTIIAPMLADVANRVQELGGSIVARVEWAKDEGGITYLGVDGGSGVTQQLTALAALSRGNIDAMMMEAMKRFDCSQSMFLHQYAKR